MPAFITSKFVCTPEHDDVLVMRLICRQICRKLGNLCSYGTWYSRKMCNCWRRWLPSACWVNVFLSDLSGVYEVDCTDGDQGILSMYNDCFPHGTLWKWCLTPCEIGVAFLTVASVITNFVSVNLSLGAAQDSRRLHHDKMTFDTYALLYVFSGSLRMYTKVKGILKVWEGLGMHVGSWTLR